MAEFANYQQAQEPSLTHELFGSPLKAQWTLQKGSMMMNFMSNSMWKSAMEGKGVRWSGVVGFRGIALGKEAAGWASSKALSPIAGIMRRLGKETMATTLETSGLFGKGGLFNKQGTEGFSKIGKFLGGGSFGKFNIEEEKLLERMKGKRFTFKNIEEIKKTFPKGMTVEKANIELMGGGKLSKIKTLRKFARIGRFASWTGAAMIGYDVGKAIGGFAINTIGNITDRLESAMGNLVNKKMEFGGKVGIGFYTGRSGTERQRALSAIGRGYGGSPGQGSEAAMQHIDSTW